jgi:tetratricopeptide (TPR) repeat protein
MSDKAVSAYDHVMGAKPDATAYVTRAQLRRLSDSKDRMADLDAALKIDPKNSGAIAAKAELLTAQGDLNGALAIYETGMRAVPGQSPLTLGRGILLYRMGRKAEAERILAAWRKGALTATELNSLCWQKATAGILLESAAQDCRDALKLNPNHGAYLDSLGMALLKLGKLDDALAAYDKAVAAGTGADSLFGRAVVYERKGDHGHSEADAVAARKIDPDIDVEFAQYYGLKLSQASAAVTK